MPDFAEGMVYFNGQRPAQGRLNICAVDNTLRFMDKNGKEMAASDIDNVAMVKIDTVTFIHNQGVFYRFYPVGTGFGIALKREVKTFKGAKQGAYGTTSQTSSIRESSSMYVDGVAYNIYGPVPYDVSEILYLYKEEVIYPLNKRNLKRLFPARKADIDAYFVAGNTVPETVSDAVSLLRSWAE